MAPINPKAQAAYQAMKSFGIDDAPKIKRVLKKLLKEYDKNWQKIEDGNYNLLLNAIFDEDTNGAVTDNDTPEVTDAVQKMDDVEEEEEEPPLKKRRGQAGAAAGSSGLVESKPKPPAGGLNSTGTEATLRKRKGKEPIEEVEIFGNTSRVDLELATSSSGEFKIYLSCDSPNFKLPSIEEAIKLMEEKCGSFYKAMDPSFSVAKLMKDCCECFVELAVATNSAIAEKPSTPEPALDALNRSTIGGGCYMSPNIGLQDGETNGKLVDDFAVVKYTNGVIGTTSQSLVVVEQQQGKTRDELRLMYDAGDITRGEEKLKISLSIEPNSGPLSSFHYMPQNVVYHNAHVQFSLARIGEKECCSSCSGDCLSSSSPCMCSSPSRKGFSYTSEGLVKEEFLKECISMIRDPQKHHLAHCPQGKCKIDSSPKPCKGHLDRKFIKECWVKCGCSKSCVNRVVQRGISCKLQVFWTPEGKGWGLRTLDELPKGTFVCEYVGEVLTISELHERGVLRKNNEKHSYAVILDADWSSKNIQENQTLCLDSTFYGNVARFINHRCSDANLIEIPVQLEASDRHYYHVALFTTRKVEANEELTWDYGLDFSDQDSHLKTFSCSCGSSLCRDMHRPRGSRLASNVNGEKFHNGCHSVG